MPSGIEKSVLTAPVPWSNRIVMSPAPQPVRPQPPNVDRDLRCDPGLRAGCCSSASADSLKGR